MGVYDWQSNSDQTTDSDSTMVSVLNAGNNALRITVPMEIREEHDIGDDDHLSIEATEDGFKAKVVDA